MLGRCVPRLGRHCSLGSSPTPGSYIPLMPWDLHSPRTRGFPLCAPALGGASLHCSIVPHPAFAHSDSWCRTVGDSHVPWGGRAARAVPVLGSDRHCVALSGHRWGFRGRFHFLLWQQLVCVEFLSQGGAEARCPMVPGSVWQWESTLREHVQALTESEPCSNP